MELLNGTQLFLELLFFSSTFLIPAVFSFNFPNLRSNLKAIKNPIYNYTLSLPISTLVHISLDLKSALAIRKLSACIKGRIPSHAMLCRAHTPVTNPERTQYRNYSNKHGASRLTRSYFSSIILPSAHVWTERRNWQSITRADQCAGFI